MVERALALDDHPVAAPLALLDHPLDRALGEVADQRGRPRRPSRRSSSRSGRSARTRPTARRPAPPRAARARPTSCRSRSRSRPSGSPACPGRGGRPIGGLHPRPAAGGSRRSASRPPRPPRRTPGRRRGTCGGPEWTSRPAPIASRIVVRHAVRQLAAGRRDADEERVRRGSQGEGLVERRDDRDVAVRAGSRRRCRRPGSSRSPRRRRPGRSGSPRPRSCRGGSRSCPRRG